MPKGRPRKYPKKIEDPLLPVGSHVLVKYKGARHPRTRPEKDSTRSWVNTGVIVAIVRPDETAIDAALRMMPPEKRSIYGIKERYEISSIYSATRAGEPTRKHPSYLIAMQRSNPYGMPYKKLSLMRPWRNNVTLLQNGEDV